ncbi:MAG: potassium-transporting ATPase subunit KdpC [Pseudomonadota bacterium]|jgi:K+-transporting ATPase ATPase C chain
MLKHVRPAIAMFVLMTVITGLAYPAVVTSLAQTMFPFQANGSLLKTSKDEVVGSSLIAQGFAKPEYLHPRPSAAGDKGYDASNSSGSNLGPLDKKLIDREAGDTAALRKEVGDKAVIPADAVTTSASGLDPDISPDYAHLQAKRIAAARGIDPAQVDRLISEGARGRSLAIFGEPRVNVLELNRALDSRFPVKAAR